MKNLRLHEYDKAFRLLLCEKTACLLQVMVTLLPKLQSDNFIHQGGRKTKEQGRNFLIEN